MIRRIQSDFVPVALKAAQVNGPPPGEEGRLYHEIGRSKPAPQGICAVNSAGKVLAWALMFDDDRSISAFLDYVLARFKEFPDGAKPFAAKRFMRYPGLEMNEVADEGLPLPAPRVHPDGERCVGSRGVPEGTLLGRAIGRSYQDGKPNPDIHRQENYSEDTFEIPVPLQEAAAKAARDAGNERFRLPEGIGRALVGSAYLGMLDVNPLGGPGGPNEVHEVELWGLFEKGRIRIEGTSRVAGGMARGALGAGDDGRVWSHDVRLQWKGLMELKENRVTRLLATATGREKLRWANENLGKGGSDVAKLPGGRPIDLDAEVRYGLEARPAAGREIGPGEEAPAPGLPAKMKSLGDAVGGYLRAGGDAGRLQPEMEKLQRLLEKKEFPAAEKQIERVLEIVKER